MAGSAYLAGDGPNCVIASLAVIGARLSAFAQFPTEIEPRDNLDACEFADPQCG